MDRLPKDSILEFRPDTLRVVRKVHGFNKPKDIKGAVDELEDWVKKQNHFTKKDFSRHYLEMMIISNKGSMERAKARLDKVCTLRTTMPQYFGDFHIKNDFKEFDNIIIEAVLPKLTVENNRVFLAMTNGQKFKDTVIPQFIRRLCLYFEYMKLYDYSDGLIIIGDLRDVSLWEVIKRVSLNDFREAAEIIVGGYGTRLKGVHMLSTSSIINIFIWFIKQVMSAKLTKRIHVHATPKTLDKYVEKEILPVEYGGTERSLENLHGEWVNILSSDGFRQYLRDMSQARTDESRRSARISSFEILNID